MWPGQSPSDTTWQEKQRFGLMSVKFRTRVYRMADRMRHRLPIAARRNTGTTPLLVVSPDAGEAKRFVGHEFSNSEVERDYDGEAAAVRHGNYGRSRD